MNWKDYLAANRADFEVELLDFLRIPSVSALPAHAPDVRRAGIWVAQRLEAAGMENIETLETGGHPVVYADWLHAPGKPTIMIYGHFDTQPVDPIELWDNPPFVPTVVDGRVYARGASDDKGNMFAPILALEALLKTTGKLPVNVKCFFEGQEEIGSPTLPPFIAANRDKFACDFVVSADGGQWTEDQPAIALAFKGLCGLQIDVVGPSHDVHSGGYGGAIQNPIHALVQLLDSMRGEDGRILVEGFYDSVRPLSAEDRAQIAAVPFDEKEYMERLGIEETFGEAGYSTLERAWGRPTLELNGIWGGFTGDGTKTVLPSQAHAKITCRLVADQKPPEIAKLIERHVATHTPPGVKVKVTITESGAYPYLMPADHPANQAARDVHMKLYGKEPLYVRSGGSIPVCSMFLDSLGVYTLNFGFGLNDERLHSPNEFFRLASFEKGQVGYCMLLERLGA
jgi:acetylornithine deacetylase/succinyl-diaminopimelate desuccinylase-like protein